jgi:hypothetical protein
MTSQSPRIYTYKITFEEVSYYYYGVHKEKKFDEKYLGSPVTHKWCWDFYTPKKEILQVFPYTDDGWEEAKNIEKRIIKLFYNSNKWCLNKSCGNAVSLDICRKTGKKYGCEKGKKVKELGVGIFSIPIEEHKENCKKGGKIGGKKTYEMKVGVHGRNEEQRKIDAKKGGTIGGKIAYEMKVGVHGRNEEQRKIDAKKGGDIGGKLVVELGLGIHGRTKEQKMEDGRKGGKISGSQRWMCLETGFITNAGNLTKYQKRNKIDTSKRVKVS